MAANDSREGPYAVRDRVQVRGRVQHGSTPFLIFRAFAASVALRECTSKRPASVIGVGAGPIIA
jgi:hypothetical protein